MKSQLITTLLSAAAAPLLFGAATTPVGYTTETLKADQYNLIGITLHKPVLVVGSLTAVSGTTLTDSNVDFDATLTGGTTYLLEITSGTLNGGIQEITSWAGNTVTTPQDLSASLQVGDTYQIREATTIADLFGATNTAGFIEGTSTAAADVVWIPAGGGAFTKYFYHPGAVFPPVSEGWKQEGNLGADASTTPIVYTDAILVQKRTTDLDLVVTGEVKVVDTMQALEGDGSSVYNFLSGVYPVGSTLDSSGLANSLLHGTSTASADVVWMPDGAGGYAKYYYTDGTVFPPVAAGWKNAGGAASGSVELTSGIIIQRRGAATNATISEPYNF